MMRDGWAAKRTVRLTTHGRKTGRERTVKIWFVPAGAQSIFVQHVSRKPAQWYANLRREPAVSLDFGDGTVSARAVPIEDAAEVAKVLAMVRRKYLSAWLIQLLSRGAKPVAAEISFGG